jgi:plasmid stabilization system protein ParE
VTRRIVFRPQAEAETAEAADWYEEQRTGLGKDFLRSFDQTISSIAQNPFRYRKLHGETRRASMPRFPYGILYRVGDDEIVIVACMHARRDPKRWQSRR